MGKLNLQITVTRFLDDEFAPARKMLEDYGFHVRYNEHNRNYTLADMKDYIGELDAIIAQGDIWNDEIFENARRLKILSRFGVGYEKVDLQSARRHGVDVTITRVQELSRGVAELALGMMIGWARSIPSIHHEVINGEWSFHKGTQLTGKTVALMGFGNIAKHLAELLKPFRVRILAYDKAPDQAMAARLGVEMVSFEEAMRQADYISIQMPSTPETRHLFNADTLALVKTGACIVNTSRGALIDENALYDALVAGRLAGAALDVFEKEPTDPQNPLLRLPNVLALPHIAGNTREAFAQMAIESARAVIDCFEHRPYQWLVN